MGAAWLERVRRRDGTLPPVTEELLREHALTLRVLKRHVPAEAALRELLAMMDQEKHGTLRRFADLSNLADTLINQQRAAEALPLLQQVVQFFEQHGKDATGVMARVLPLAQKRLMQAGQAVETGKTAGR